MTFNKLISFVREALHPENERSPEQQEEGIRLATAAVLLDVAYADSSMSEAEEGRVVEHLRNAFDLNDERAHDLIRAAEEIRNRTIDHWHLTNFIRNNMSLEERSEIVRTMWRIIYADGYFHQYEGYLVRKLSELLGFQHPAMIEIKLAVKEELRKAGKLAPGVEE